MDINTEVKAGLETEHIIDFSDRLYKLVLAIIALGGVYVLGQMMYNFSALPQNTPHEISVSGEGKAYAKPDIAVLNLGVTTQAQTSQDAVSKNNSMMNEIIKAVKDLGVDNKDIQTTSYNLYPVYGQDVLPMGVKGSSAAGGSVGIAYPYPGGNRIVGYSLNQQIEVKVRNFDNINKILDSATSKGANTIGGIQFTVEDMEKVKAEARGKAIAEAKKKASTLSSQSGIRLGSLVNVSEGYSPMPYAYGMGGTIAKETSAPDIQPGQMEVNMTITLTYRVR